MISVELICYLLILFIMLMTCCTQRTNLYFSIWESMNFVTIYLVLYHYSKKFLLFSGWTVDRSSGETTEFNFIEKRLIPLISVELICYFLLLFIILMPCCTQRTHLWLSTIISCFSFIVWHRMLRSDLMWTSTCCKICAIDKILANIMRKKWTFLT